MRVQNRVCVLLEKQMGVVISTLFVAVDPFAT